MSNLPQSFFVDTAAVWERTVKFQNGAEEKLFFKDLSQDDWEAYMAALHSPDEGSKKKARAKLIATALCEPDGSPALTVERAETLKPAFALALSNEIMKANQFTADEGKG